MATEMITLDDARELLGPSLIPPKELAAFYGIAKMPVDMQALLVTYILFPEMELEERAVAVGKSQIWVRLVSCTDMFAAKIDSIRKARNAMDQFALDTLHAEILSTLFTEINAQLSGEETMPALPLLIGYLDKLQKKVPAGGQTIAIQNNVTNPQRPGAVPSAVVQAGRKHMQEAG